MLINKININIPFKGEHLLTKMEQLKAVGCDKNTILEGVNSLMFFNFEAKHQQKLDFSHDFICFFQRLRKCLPSLVTTGVTSLG